jgi:hypothetical protein
MFLLDSTIEGPVCLASRSLDGRLIIRVVRVRGCISLIISMVLLTSCCLFFLGVSALESGDHNGSGLLGGLGLAPFLWHYVVLTTVTLGRSTFTMGCSA